MLQLTFLLLGQLWQLFEVSQILEFLRYLCLEMGIYVIYINEIIPQVYQMTETLGPYRMPTTWRQYTQ